MNRVFFWLTIILVIGNICYFSYHRGYEKGYSISLEVDQAIFEDLQNDLVKKDSVINALCKSIDVITADKRGQKNIGLNK